MSYYLRVRFKNNVQRPRHTDLKRIALIEHYFKKQMPAGKAFLEYNMLYSEERIRKLRSGQSIYERKFSPGRPRSIDEEQLHQLVLSNPFKTTRELAKELGCTFSAVAKRLRAMHFGNKWSVWVS